MINYRDHISIDLNERGAQPCVRGSEVTVYQVLDHFATGFSKEDILRRYPALTYDDLEACTLFTAACERQLALVSAV